VPPGDLKTTWRRVGGNFVLLLAGCWILVLIGVSAAAESGDSGIPLINWVTILVPGFALIPGSYYAVKFRRTSDPEEAASVWNKCALYGFLGLILGIGTTLSLNAVAGSVAGQELLDHRGTRR
jgi:hypothetical protein